MTAKSVSFHVGVGSFDATVYPKVTRLKSAALDARSMFNLARGLGYTPLDLQPRDLWDGSDPAPPNVLIDGAATYETVVGLFQQTAALLKDEGDRCFITISSHGTQFLNEEEGPNLDGNRDEAVCLHDYTLLDDVLYGLLSTFEKGVNVFVVLDCCHAGATSSDVGAIVENFKTNTVNAFFSLVEKTPLSFVAKGRLLLGAPKVARKPVKSPPPLAVALQKQFPDFGKPNLRANVAVFQACGADEQTFDGAKDGDLSVYTRKFVDSAKNSEMTLGQLVDAIKAATPTITDCTPRFQRTGGDDFLGIPIRA